MALIYNGTRYGLNGPSDEGQWQQITRSDALIFWRESVKATANWDIAWYYNNFPFSEWDMGNAPFQPYADGNALNLGFQNDYLSEDSFGAAGSVINSVLVNRLLESTRKYLAIRKITAKLNVTGDGGNTGSRPTPGIVFDETKKAFLHDGYKLNIEDVQYTAGDALVGNVPYGFVNTSGLYSGDIINNWDVIKFIWRLQLKYVAARDTIAFVQQVDVCHASCHSSCHGSRGRR